MNLYEVRVGKCEPLVFDNVQDAMWEASGFKARGKSVSVTRKVYLEGARLRTTRLSVAKYDALVRRLTRQCKRYAYVKAMYARKCLGSVDETEWGEPMKATERAISVIAAKVAEYEPTSEVNIDDYGHVVKFYDSFYVMRVYAARHLVNGWTLLYETPQADPKPHQMDW